MVLEFKNVSLIALLVILSIFFILELQVSIPSPITFGDEAIHTAMSRYMAKELEYPMWRTIEGTDAFKNNFGSPPLLQLLEGGFFLIFGFNEIIVKLLLPFISLLTALAIYLITKRLFDDKIAFIAAVVFMTIPSVVTYSVTFYVEGLATLYFALAVLLFIYGIKTENKKFLVLSGAFIAFAYLTEISSLNLIIFLILAFSYSLIVRKDFDISKYGVLLVAFIVITSGFLIRNLALYGTPGCYIPVNTLPIINKIFDNSGCLYKGIQVAEQEYQYEGRTADVGSEQSVYRMGIINYLDFAYGNIWLVVLGIFGGVFLTLQRKDPSSILLLLMLLTFLPYFHFTAPRAEDAARNLLGWTPFIAVFTGIYFGRLYEFLQSHQKYIAPIIFLVIIILAYQNITLKLGTMKDVKQFSPAFFEACDWARNNLPKDAVLSTVWVHRAAYSCERITVGNPPDIFLSKDLELIKKTAKNSGITHLFIQKFSLSNKPLSETYTIDSVKFFEDNPDNFNKVYENGPSLEQCIQQGGCDGNIIYEIAL